VPVDLRRQPYYQHAVFMMDSCHKIVHVPSARLARTACVAIFACVLLSACAETEFVASSVKSLGVGSESSNGRYKVGKPYRINGTLYTPNVDYNYSETGIASWYGSDFHGNDTANGEVFDMNEISAAHRTLPLPSMVRVTNLKNGRALNVRVNDRGPFSRGRIIDMSRRGAQLLGFERDGTAMVRVDILAYESRKLAGEVPGQVAKADKHPVPNAAPRVAVTSKPLAPPPGTRTAPPPSANHQVATTGRAPAQHSRKAAPLARVDGKVSQVALAKAPTVFVQAGAFSQYANAHRLQVMLNGLAPTAITQKEGAQSRMFRVRLGPVRSVEDADALLARVVASGLPNARIVVD
jgi:rare lipoprotein A